MGRVFSTGKFDMIRVSQYLIDGLKGGCKGHEYSSLLICAHGRIKSKQRTFCKTTVQLEAAMDIVKKTRSY